MVNGLITRAEPAARKPEPCWPSSIMAPSPFMDALAILKDEGWKGLLKVRLVEAQSSKGNALITDEAFGEWLDSRQLVPTTRKSYEHNHRTLMYVAGARKKMKDLPAIRTDYRVHVLKLGKNHRAFNLSYGICLTWVKDTLGEESDVYRELRKVERVKVKKTHRENAYFSPTDIRNIMARLPKSVADMLWFQTVHGMNAKEYLQDGCWPEGEHGLFINGQKNDHRQRTVPLITEPAPVSLRAYSAYFGRLKRASEDYGKRFTTRDARRTYTRWCSMAGVAPHRIPMYAGHSAGTQTQEYQFHATQEFLQEDAAKLEAWITEQLKKFPPDSNVKPLKPGPKPEPNKEAATKTFRDVVKAKAPKAPTRKPNSPMVGVSGAVKRPKTRTS